MNTKRIFFDFLQKNNALKAYKRAFYAWHDRKLRPYEYYPLGVAFVWCRTQEGYDYWKELDENWYNHFKSVKKRYHF